MSNSWLNGPRDPERMRPLLERMAPGLKTCTLRPVMKYSAGSARPSETVLVGASHVLKVAWSPDTAENLRRQRTTLEALKSCGLSTPAPEVTASSDTPVAFLYPLVAGERLTRASCSALLPSERAGLVADWACMVSELQSPAVLAGLQAKGVVFSGPLDIEPHERVDYIRRILLPRADLPWLAGLLDEVEQTLQGPAARVLLHGDLGGHNVMVRGHPPRISGMIDVEQFCAGDPCFDLRHLLSQADSPAFCVEVLSALEARTGISLDRERILAWNVCLDLGDVAWRLETGAPIEGRAEPRILGLWERLPRDRAALGA